ncbi:MAG: hemin uptake protein HemP [Paenirhodobacter sp.]|uniref:hemin uptake protein HemP n=1 Tax=Paenirhodobacter sp. TaxID=1965326 RepID=UPI003D0AC75B
MNMTLSLRDTAEALPAHDARALTSGGHLAQIFLDGQTYTLRITKQGKLILTK